LHEEKPQAPPVQVAVPCVPGQALPHIPQLFRSVIVWVQLPLQTVPPFGHSQRPSTQVWPNVHWPSIVHGLQAPFRQTRPAGHCAVEMQGPASGRPPSCPASGMLPSG
jgi:hypothetical protein